MLIHILTDLFPHRTGITVQIDVGCFQYGYTGWGLCIRNQQGSLIYVACKKENIPIDPLLAESVGPAWCFTVVQSLGLSWPAFLTDVVVVVDCMLDRTMRATIDPIILDCKHL